MSKEKLSSPQSPEVSDLKGDIILTSANIFDYQAAIHYDKDDGPQEAWWGDESRVYRLASYARPSLGDYHEIVYRLTAHSRIRDQASEFYRYTSYGCYVERCDEKWVCLKESKLDDACHRVLSYLETAPLSRDPDSEEAFRAIVADNAVDSLASRRRTGMQVLQVAMSREWAYDRVVKYIVKKEPMLTENEVRAAINRQIVHSDDSV